MSRGYNVLSGEFGSILGQEVAGPVRGVRLDAGAGMADPVKVTRSVGWITKTWLG